MAESQPSPSDPEPLKVPDITDERRAPIVNAIERLGKGERLPAPKTWDEFVIGVVWWLQRHWSDENGTRRPCPVCGGGEWELGQVVGFAADARWPAPPNIGHGSFPYAQVGCKTCGNTMFLNVLLIFEPQQPWTP